MAGSKVMLFEVN